MRIGKIGEKWLETWASQGGFVCSKPDDDIFGWDYILEIQNIPFDLSAPDKSEANISCYIQVKTTKSKIIKTKIKLSNWVYMVKTPLPTFILYIQLNKENDPINVCLSHLDENLLSKVLKKLRESKNLELNKHYYYHKPKAEDFIDKINGLTLRKIILDHIGIDYHAYCQKKMELNKNLGYGNDRVRGKFKINKSIDEIVDFSLGIEKMLEVNDLVFEDDVRFGIPGKIIESKVAYIEASPITRPVKVIIESKKNDMCETYDGKIILPFGILKEIPKDKFKYKIETAIGDLEVKSDNSFTFNIKLSFKNIENTLKDFLPYSRLALLIGRNVSDIKFSIVLDGLNVMSFYFPKYFVDELVIDEKIIGLCENIENLNKVVSFFDEEKNVNLNFDYLTKTENTLSEMRSFIDVLIHDNIYLGFTVNEELDAEKEIAIPRILSIKYNEKILIIAGVHIGKIIYKEKDGSFKAKIKPIIKLKRKINELNKDYKDELFEKIVSEYENLCEVIDFR
ncbi:hypothetical protein [Marispirochaeta sp.]|uniref:hypothetical protein n=1 Tax=Marispirochaeta sp. TaxID=2038653 RepID=UPI0029C6AC31|nr:hypothetical protein [Marispirochaeta sp.]